ncbi:MAG: NADPH-dependent 7-cyano-7-deazaguanine reductase [Planctomycetes bacterium]|nr:NADPH-dependent 7-cyano-7-deazaguanine reductase [Planctomycetota bacterium]
MSDHLKALGTARAQFDGLETFDAPAGIKRVSLVSDECCAVCPVTGQPDWYTITVEYRPGPFCIESKTFKLYVQSFRNSGMFCEQFADKIAQDCANVLKVDATATVNQKPRGGVAIVSTATRSPQ